MIRTPPRISVIIPAFNRERLILETLKSIADQTFSDFECLVVDDGSSDRTKELVKDFALKDERFSLLCRPNTYAKGAPSCRNYGLHLAKGEFVQFFDSDDILLREALSDKVQELDADKELQFVVSKTDFLLSDGQLSYPDQRLFYPQTFEEFLEEKSIFFTPGPMFRSVFLKEQKLAFDPSLERHQEFEFYTRLMSGMPKFKILDKVHCYYRMHTASIKSKSDEAGNLYYRRTKLKAIERINKNSEYTYVLALQRVFRPYAITTLKVAVYQRNLAMIWYTLSWMIRFYGAGSIRRLLK